MYKTINIMNEFEKNDLADEHALNQRVSRLRKDELRLLGMSRHKQGVKSGSTLAAQTVTLSQLQVDRAVAIEAYGKLLEAIKKESICMYSLVVLMAATGCRVSEALAVSYHDIAENGTCKLRGLKGSKDRVVVVPQLSAFFANCVYNKIHPFRDFDRFFVHRFFKKKGLVYQSEKSSKESVTHSFRHKAAMGLQAAGVSLEGIREFLGQCNESSTKYYIR